MRRRIEAPLQDRDCVTQRDVLEYKASSLDTGIGLDQLFVAINPP